MAKISNSMAHLPARMSCQSGLTPFYLSLQLLQVKAWRRRQWVRHAVQLPWQVLCRPDRGTNSLDVCLWAGAEHLLQVVNVLLQVRYPIDNAEETGASGAGAVKQRLQV